MGERPGGPGGTDDGLRRRRGPRRFPGWLLIPLGGAAGGVVAGWWGAAFGAVVGLVVWRGRAG